MRPWPQLLRWLDRLPKHSHYKAALADDEDLARRTLAGVNGSGPPPAPRPPITEWSRQVELLTAAVDELRELHATLIAANSKKGKRPKVRPVPRPETAVMRLEKQRTLAQLAEIERKLLGGG